MNLTEQQRLIIANSLQDVLEEAKQRLKLYLIELNTGADTQEQMNNYNTFANSYFNNLRDDAPRALDLIDFNHKIINH